MSSTVQSAETYGQMANMSSGSCGSSFLNNSSSNNQQMRSSFREEPVEFLDNRDDGSDSAVYNLPWDVKNKASQLLLQSAKASLESSKSSTKPAQQQQQQQPPPVPQCPPPSTLTLPTKAVQEEDDETQYCAPWDLKLQEEMFKKMSESKKTNDSSSGSPKAAENETSAVNRSQNDSITNGPNNTSLANNSLSKSNCNNNNHNNSELNSSMKSNKSSTDLNGIKPSVQPPSYEEANEYSPPWELKQSSIMQSIQSQSGLKHTPSTATGTSNMPAPLSTSSTASTLTNTTTTNNNPSALSTLFNQFSRTRLSTRSNTSSSSSTRSSTSSLSASSPPSIPAPPSIPPPPPPMSASSVSRCNSTCSQNHIIQQSPRLPHRHLSQQSSASSLIPGNSNNGLLMSRNGNLNSSLNHQCSSCSLNKKTGMSSANNGHSCMGHQQQQQQQQFPNTLLTHSSYLNEGKFCSWGNSTGSSSNTNSFENNNCASSIEVDPKTFSRQGRTGSNHHFAYPSVTSQFQTNSMQIPCSMNANDFKTMQIQAIPVTALFSQNSLPANMMPLNIQNQTLNNHQPSQLVSPASMNHLLLLERQIWFHGKITRKHAENRLENRPIGSFLIRQSESGNANDFSLSLIGSGVVHMRISIKNGEYILGQCSQPFNSIVKMVEHYGKVEVPIKGALHVRLTNPVARSS